MNRFLEISSALADLEEQHRRKLNADFDWTDALRSRLTGTVQFGAVDGFHRANSTKLPIVVAVGINYTQGGTVSKTELVPYSSPRDRPGTVRNTESREAVALALEAFNRNRTAWLTSASLGTFNSPSGAFASSASAADTVAGDFILVMTNLCPFITTIRWGKLAQDNPEACRYVLDTWPNTRYLNDLFIAFGGSVDLWIGHSSIYGTDWVFPDFLKLMTRWSVRNWMLTPNLCGRMAANLHFKRQFVNRNHDLFPLFAP
jgi:hypothetical protein